MACPEYEDRILEMQEGTLPISDRFAVEEHLAACDGCRRFAQRLSELDAALAAAHSMPGLSVDFKARLMQRIDRDAPRLSAEAIEARKREIEAEYHTIMAGLPHRVWLGRLPLLLDALGLISTALIAWSILRSMPESRSILESLGPLMARVTTDSMAWIWAAASRCVGLLWIIRRRPVIRL
jgi:anti-sigma factor RsiW